MIEKLDLIKDITSARGYCLQDAEVWATADLPVERRVPESFLRGLKKLLVGWGCKPVRYDTDTLIFKAGQELVVTICVKELTGKKKLECT